MATAKTDKKLVTDLQELLAEHLPGVQVSVEHSDRWNRMCVTFVWSEFKNLLPEERFRRLLTHIPERFAAERLNGYVWLELADDESVDDFLKLPRSEDIASRESEIYRGLVKVGFFDSLRSAMKPSPAKACKGDFSQTAKVLSAAGKSAVKSVDAKLLFIRHGAYCDCQVVDTIESELAKEHAGK